MSRRHFLAMWLAALLPIGARAHDGHGGGHEGHGGKPAPSPGPSAQEVPYEDPSRTYFTDLPVLDQRGESRRFYTDLLKDRIVLISFFYTSCPDFCPFMMDKLARVRGLLGPRVGKDIHFVSISVDPEQDTPERLRAFARSFEITDGWDLITGKKENIDYITYRLGQYTETAESHTTLLLAGNVAARRWIKLRPDSTEPQIATWLRDLSGDGSS